jgi:hypothetical protein
MGSETLPLILFLVFLPKTKSETALTMIPIYSLLYFVSNAIDLTHSMKGFRHLFYGFVTFFEFVLFSYFIYLNLTKKRNKRLIIIFSLLFLAFLVVYTFTFPLVRIDSIPIGFETIFVLLFSFFYLFEQMNNPKVLFIYNQYQFWVIVGFMLYLSGSFFIYLFTNQLPQDEVVKYWFIIDIFLVVKNLFFSIAILVFANQQKKKIPQTFPTLKAIY